MNADQAANLIANLLQTTLLVAGPILIASLLAGVFVGILQTATQINEASVSYVVKVVAVGLVLVVLGPRLAQQAIGYTKDNFKAVATVVR
ncbi:MAG: flagellar biosynthetic protein FliQ [Polyangiaceae bacterium]